MVQRICPVCDRVMKARHYCRNCRSWVKEPYVREVSYYLNECHPQQETACSYHHAPEAFPREAGGRGTIGRSTAGRSAADERNARSGGRSADDIRRAAESGWRPPSSAYSKAAPTSAYREAAESSAYPGMAHSSAHQRSVQSSAYPRTVQPPVYPGTAGTSAYPGMAQSSAHQRTVPTPAYTKSMQPTQGKRRPWLLPVVLIGLFFISRLFYMLPFGVVFPELESSFSQKVESVPIFDGAFDEEAEDWYVDSTELSDEEVKMAGTACNGDGHFAVSGAETAELLKKLLNEHGYQISDTNETSYNEQYEDGETWFSTWVMLECISEESGSAYYAEVDYDTADGRLHQITLSLKPDADTAELTAQLLEFLTDRWAIAEPLDCAAQVREEMAGAIVNEGNYEFAGEDVQIYGEVWENTYEVRIDAVH